MHCLMQIHGFIQNQILCIWLCKRNSAIIMKEAKHREEETNEERLKRKNKASRQAGFCYGTGQRYYDSHSSRHRITPALELPTRTLRGPPHSVPIWNCTRWRLPRFTVTEYARLCGPVPRLIPLGFRRTVVNRHPVLWCPDLPPVSVAMHWKPAAVWLASLSILQGMRHECQKSFMYSLPR